MSRILKVAAAQLGPITLKEPRSSAVKRMIVLMQNAKAQGADLVVFPELALTTSFPRWFTEDQSEIDKYFETEMPSKETKPLFVEARKLKIGFNFDQLGLIIDPNADYTLTYRATSTGNYSTLPIASWERTEESIIFELNVNDLASRTRSGSDFPERWTTDRTHYDSDERRPTLEHKPL